MFGRNRGGETNDRRPNNRQESQDHDRTCKLKEEGGEGGMIRNKAGYTATSCGRVGRGGNARFPTFQLDHLYGPTNRPTDQPTDGRTKPLIELRVRN